MNQRKSNHDVALSIMMPVASTGVQLRTVVGALLQRNLAFFRRVPSELILVDSIQNPGNAQSVEELRAVFPSDASVAIEHLETPVIGVNAKVMEGFKRSRGAYVMRLEDEAIAIYDFLDDAYGVATDGFLCSIPYLEAQAPQSSTYPLRYGRRIPMMPITFLLTRREIFAELLSGLPSQAPSTQHWSLACWEMGLVPAYPSRHLRYCPIVKMDSKKPDAYLPIRSDLIREGNEWFERTWTVERRVHCHQRMTLICERLVSERGCPLRVITGPNGGVYLTHVANGEPLPELYTVLSTPEQVRAEAERSLKVWLDSNARPDQAGPQRSPPHYRGRRVISTILAKTGLRTS